jgi:hypothetical protein
VGEGPRKGGGPYCRLRERDGEGESRYGAATATVEPVPARIGRRGFEAADAALDVFDEMVTQAARTTCVYRALVFS